MLSAHTLPFLGGLFLYSISSVLETILVKEGEGFLAHLTERALKYTGTENTRAPAQWVKLVSDSRPRECQPRPVSTESRRTSYLLSPGPWYS